MTWEKLPTNYKDMVWQGLKKYTQIDNDDGTISFRDDTKYVNKDESFFGAKDANRMNDAMNYIMASLEKGTNLYGDFQEFFNKQKQLFVTSKDNASAEFIQKLNLDYSKFIQYIDELRGKGKVSLDSIEKESKQRIDNYESQQRALFDLWFSDIKAKLSGDVTGKLQTDIENLDFKVIGFCNKEISFSQNGNIITEKMDDGKLVTEFVSDTSIVQKLFKNDVLRMTKRIIFEPNGSIKEVIE